MYKFLTKNGQLIAFGSGALLVILFAISWAIGNKSFQAMPEADQPNTGIFDIGLIGSAFLVVAAVVILLVFGVMQTASNLKESMKGIIGIVAIIVIFLISYSIAGVDKTGIIADAAAKMGVSDNTQKLIGGGLYTMIIMSVLTVIAFIGAEIQNFFK